MADASTVEGRRLIREQMRERQREETRALERQVAEEDAANERQATQAVGRLITTHRRPQTDRKDLLETHDHAIRQWNARQGVVGPTGSEGGLLYRQFNNPTDPNYELYQQFGYQHDMQATDAFKQFQDGTSNVRGKGPGGNANDQDTRRVDYNTANRNSAVQGMLIIRRGGTLQEALAATRQTFQNFGFNVQQHY